MNSKLLHMLKAATNAYGNNEYPTAKILYQKILAAIPGQPDALYGLYKIEIQTGDKDRAKNLLMQACRQVELMAQTPQLKEISERWKKALYEFGVTDRKEASGHAPRKISEKIPKIKSLMSKGLMKEAAFELNELEKKYGINVDIALLKFDVLQYHGDLEAAVELAPYLVKTLSNNGTVWLALAVLFSRSSLVHSAMTAYSRLLALEPENAKAYSEMGVLYMNRNLPEKAENYFRKCIELNSAEVLGWVNLSTCLAEQEKIEESLAVITKAREIFKNNKIVDHAMLIRCLELGDYQLGRHLLAQIVQTLGKDPDSLVTIANMQSRLGQSCAVKTLGVAIEQLPKNISVIKGKGKIESRKYIALMPIGRAGSLFFHSLVDGHPEVATIPGVYLKGFFGEGVWPRIQSKSIMWRKEMVTRFMRIYEPMFEGDHPAPIPGNPLGGGPFVGRSSGLNILGEAKNEILKLDAALFSDILNRRLEAYDEIGAGDFLNEIHFSWEEVRRGNLNDDKIKAIFYHVHNPNLNEYIRFTKAIPEIHNLFIAREPIQGMESWIYQLMPDRDAIERIPGDKRKDVFLHMYGQMIKRLNSVFTVQTIVQAKPINNWYIKLEDIKSEPEGVMREFAKWMGIEFDHSLMLSEFNGLKYWGPPSKLSGQISGFDKKNIERKRGIFFSNKDIEIFNVLFDPWRLALGYETDGEINSYALNAVIHDIDLPMDWEVSIAAAFKIPLDDLRSAALFNKRKSIFQNVIANRNFVKDVFTPKNILQ